MTIMQGLLLLGFLFTGGALVWGLSLRKRAGAPAPTAVPGLPASVTGAGATALVSLGDSLGVGLSPHLAAWAAGKGLRFIEDTKVGRFTKQQAVDMVPIGALVFVSLGTNDATSSSGADALPVFTATLRAQRPRAIIWLVPPATKALPGIASVRAMIRSLPGVTPVDTMAIMRADGLHPANYGVVFADVVSTLEAAR
jgi:lysophospholipase L1-like esterase